MEKRHTLTVAVAYVAVVLIWSTTPLAIKWSGENGGFIAGIAGRMFIGAALALLLTLWRYGKLPVHKAAIQVYAVAGIAIFGAMTAVYWGAQYISSGLISVVFGLTPIMTSLLASRFLFSERLTIIKLFGALLGVFGLAVIFSEQLSLGEQAFYGIFAVLLSVFLHSLSSVGIKRLNVQLPALVVTAGGLLFALPFFALLLLIGAESIPDHFSARTIAAIVYLGVMGSVVGFVCYFYILQHLTTSTVALVTLMTPVAALLLGYSFNNEALNASVWYGTLLVLSGLAVHQWGRALINYVWQRDRYYSDS